MIKLISNRFSISIGLVFCLLSFELYAETNTHAMHTSKQSIVVTSAWAGESPPTMPMNAGYFTLANHSQKAIELVAASSPAYGSVEIHQSQLIDGIASMRMLKSLTIGSHQQVVFESGGLHLMMHNPMTKMSAGDTFVVQLKFAEGETVDFQMQVSKVNKLKDGASSSTSGHHHHHHEM